MLLQKRTLSAFIILLLFIALFCAAAASCEAERDVFSGVSVITPTVLPKEELSASDFINISGDASSEFSVVLSAAPVTNIPGTYPVTLTVTAPNKTTKEFTASYTVRSYLKASVVKEAGFTTISASEFLDFDVINAIGGIEKATLITPEADILKFGLGSHGVSLSIDELTLFSSLIVADTIPPAATAKEVNITLASKKPEASAFVTDIVDQTTVTVTYKETPPFNERGNFPVTVILTDEGGNQTEISSMLHVIYDTEPPVISGVHDIEVVLGGTVAYKAGITVTDNVDTDVQLEVDKSGVDLSKLGTYEVKYTAIDSSGNAATVTARVFVVAKASATEDEMYALADRVLSSILKQEMTEIEKAKAIFDWTHKKITYTSGKFDKSNWVQAAHDGFEKLSGDCFTFAAVSQALLTRANLDTCMVERLSYEGESAHFWNLVDCGDGYYHFDACWHYNDAPFDGFMRTDAELDAYCKKYKLDYYYRFDKSAYPKRAES